MTPRHQRKFCQLKEKAAALGKDKTITGPDGLYEQFRSAAERKGIFVHRAEDDRHVNEIIATIAQVSGSETIITSMAVEKKSIKPYLEGKGFSVKKGHLVEHADKRVCLELYRKYARADMGITGADLAIADTATIGLTACEGKKNLAIMLPRIHVTLIHIEKMVPALKDALAMIKSISSNAPAKQIAVHVTWVSGPFQWKRPSGKGKELHIIFMNKS